MRSHVVVVAGILCWGTALEASYCGPRAYMLDEIAKAPVLAVVRVTSLHMANGPHFTGEPKATAPLQKMTAIVEVLRSFPQGSLPSQDS